MLSNSNYMAAVNEVKREKGEKIYSNLAQIYGPLRDLARIIKCDIYDIYVHLINYYHSTINNVRMNKCHRTLKNTK